MLSDIAAYNFLEEKRAFTRDSATGKYRVDFAKVQAGMDSLSSRILTMQGNGDYDGLGVFQDQYGKISRQLQRDLDRLKAKKIPVDVVFQQGSGIIAPRP